MTPRPVLHPTTLAVLEAVRAYWFAHGYSPSLRDIGGMVGRSPSVIARHVVYLRNDGYLTYDEGVSRSIVLKGAEK